MRLPNKEDGQQRVIVPMRRSSTRSDTQKKWKLVRSPQFWNCSLWKSHHHLVARVSTSLLVGCSHHGDLPNKVFLDKECHTEEEVEVGK